MEVAEAVGAVEVVSVAEAMSSSRDDRTTKLIASIEPFFFFLSLPPLLYLLYTFTYHLDMTFFTLVLLYTANTIMIVFFLFCSYVHRKILFCSLLYYTNHDFFTNFFPGM